MTGLTGYFLDMAFDEFIFVNFGFVMTIGAMDARTVAVCDKKGLTFDHMMFRRVTGGAFHLCLSAHMHIGIPCRVDQGRIQITVFDMIAASSIKVAGTARFSRSRPYVLGYLG